MAESASARDRLMPFLLDRLTDDQPQSQVETRDQRLLSPRQMRQAVLRDLAWLLNAHSRPVGDPIEGYPEVAKSVLNFGIPDLTGVTATGVSGSYVERLVKQCITRYEPRIKSASLQVKAVEVVEANASHVVTMEIKAEAYNVPMPEHLYLRTQLDLETGQVDVKEK